MNTLDANNITKSTTLEFDLCIVGGGAAGITIAKQLANSSIKIALLESGDHDFDPETQSLYEFTNSGHPLRSQQGYVSRNRYLGGSTNTWMGQCAPLDNIDFEQREWVKDSGWPITKSDIEPYYAQACETLKLPSYEYFGSNDWHKFLVGKNKDFFENDVLDASKFLLAKRPTNMKQAYLENLQDSSNIQIVTNANVFNIDAPGNEEAVKHLDIKTLSGNEFRVKAKNYVLACGGLENARILLSSNKHNPAGFANHHGVLGKYYMEHPKIMLGKLKPNSKMMRSPIFMWKKKIDKKGYIRTYLKLTPEIQKKERMLNHSLEITYPHSVQDSLAYSEGFLRNLKLSKSSIHDLIKLSPHVFRLLENLEKLMLNLPVKFDHMLLRNHMEQAPNKSSHVSLGQEKDRLGMQKLNLHLVISEQEKQDVIRLHSLINSHLTDTGHGTIESDFPPLNSDWPGMTDSSHHIGTTRMSDDSKTGYVDKDCKVHGVSNLYVIGSSVFPTGGHVNPTLTIVALATRLAEKLNVEPMN